MGKLGILTTALKTLIKYPGASARSLKKVRQNLDYKSYCETTYGITRLPTISILDILPDEELDVSPMAFLNGSSISTDYALLKSLARSIHECNYFEIGSWRGESLLNVYDECLSCVSLSLSKSQAMQFGVSELAANQIDYFLKRQPEKNIELIKSSSLDYSFETHQQKHNLIFVDGDHSFAGIKSDTQNVQKIWDDSDNAAIVWHDYGFNSEDVRYTTLAAILDGIPQSEHKYLYHVSNTMSAIYTKRKFEASTWQLMQEPKVAFDIKIKAHSLTR